MKGIIVLRLNHHPFCFGFFFGGFDLVLSSNRLNLLRRLSYLYCDEGFIQELGDIQLSPYEAEETTITRSHYHRSSSPPYRSTTNLHGRSFTKTIELITQAFLLSLSDLNRTHTHVGTYFLCCNLCLSLRSCVVLCVCFNMWTLSIICGHFIDLQLFGILFVTFIYIYF